MIGTLQSATRRHPRATAAVILGAFVMLLSSAWIMSGPAETLSNGQALPVEQMMTAVMWQTMICIVLLGIVALIGWADITGFAGRFDRGGLPAFYAVLILPAGLATLLMISLIGDSTIPSPLRLVMVILSLNAMVGLSEEILFRGIIFGALRQKHRLITAIIVSSLVFGLIHIVNLWAGQSGVMTSYQIINAMMLGGIFCAVVLHTNNLWPAILLHMVWNAYAMLAAHADLVEDPFAGQSTTEPAGFAPVMLVVPLILFIVTFLLLWRYQRRTGQSLWAIQPVVPAQGA